MLPISVYRKLRRNSPSSRERCKDQDLRVEDGQGKKTKNSKGRCKGNKGSPQVQPRVKTFDQIYANANINRQFFHATCSPRALARETIAVLSVERPMSRTNPATASTAWFRSEQNHFFIILRPFLLRVHPHYSSVTLSSQFS